jgi:hypothetical protein
VSAPTTPAPSRTTPPPRAALRRARPWAVLAAAVVAVAVVVVLLSGGDATGGRPLGPENPAPAGAKAVVEVLRQQGVEVDVTTSLAATTSRASADASGTTVVVDDASELLTADQWEDVAASADRTLLLAPGQTALDALVPGVDLVAEVDDAAVAPGCDLPSVGRAERVQAGGWAYAAEDTAQGAAVGTCLPDDASGGHGLVEVVDGGRTVTVLGATTALTNGAVLDDDDAAFALALLGRTDHVVWYLPSPDDVPEGSGTLATLTPGWVTPALALLALTAVLAGVWRGRRLGPLVVERLPVVVRASETTEGRARLYERSGSRRHALDQLRIGTLVRLRRRVGLPVSASLDDVLARVGPLTGADPRGLRHVLVDADPGDDRELVRLSDSLLDLERAVSEAVAPR